MAVPEDGASRAELTQAHRSGRSPAEVVSQLPRVSKVTTLFLYIRRGVVEDCRAELVWHPPHPYTTCPSRQLSHSVLVENEPCPGCVVTHRWMDA